jgi:ABC-2 type transport system ATP-binding protein
MIEVLGLSKSFGTLRALDQVTFQVNRGEIVGFLGANGAGKTTTMDIMCGCIGADAGTVKICGYEIAESPVEAKRNIGYLPDIPPLHLEMFVEDYISYSARLRGVPKNQLKAKVANVVEKLSLGEVRRRMIGNLSKGFRQRVALSQAIVHEPAVLVLDEPTEGLDPNQIAQIRELIKSLAGDHTIILSSHILSEVQNICQKIIIIHKGKIERQGTYEDLVQTLEAGEFYRLRVAKRDEAILPSLRSVAGVQKLAWTGPEEPEIEFALTETNGTDSLNELCLKVIQSGIGIRELSKKTHSLEEVFMQITN